MKIPRFPVSSDRKVWCPGHNIPGPGPPGALWVLGMKFEKKIIKK
jgi:hypothetical protein